MLENQRSESTPGRGGTLNSSLYAADYDNETLCEAAILNGGFVTRDEVFERMDYLLQRIVPVAERCKVQLACHLSDPPAPVLRGVERWDWPVAEGINRFLNLYDSPYHGMNLCCGTASEGMDDPTKELLPLVRDLGLRGKIFNVRLDESPASLFPCLRADPARRRGALTDPLPQYRRRPDELQRGLAGRKWPRLPCWACLGV